MASAILNKPKRDDLSRFPAVFAKAPVSELGVSKICKEM